jgi:hypothetical protein
VDVQHRLSREEIERVFLYWVQVYDDSVYLSVTPTVETLSKVVFTILALYGTDCLRGRREATPEQLDFVQRCTTRLWNSKRIVQRA